jgi:AsmA protein
MDAGERVVSKRIWMIVAVVGVVLLAGLLVVSNLLDADTYRGRIETALSDSLGRPVHLGHLKFSLFSGNLVAAAPSIGDDPASAASLS